MTAPSAVTHRCSQGWSAAADAAGDSGSSVDAPPRPHSPMAATAGPDADSRPSSPRVTRRTGSASPRFSPPGGGGAESTPVTIKLPDGITLPGHGPPTKTPAASTAAATAGSRASSPPAADVADTAARAAAAPNGAAGSAEAGEASGSGSGRGRDPVAMLNARLAAVGVPPMRRQPPPGLFGDTISIAL